MQTVIYISTSITTTNTNTNTSRLKGNCWMLNIYWLQTEERYLHGSRPKGRGGNKCKGVKGIQQQQQLLSSLSRTFNCTFICLSSHESCTAKATMSWRGRNHTVHTLTGQSRCQHTASEWIYVVFLSGISLFSLWWCKVPQSVFACNFAVNK